jgi:hypothetical protein
MPITDAEWVSISEHVIKIVQQVAGRAGDHFFVDQVVKIDTSKNLVWVTELGDTAIPLFTFDYDVTYYDESPRGTGLSFGGYKVYPKKAKVKIRCPKIGEIVLVAREMGTNRLPRCLGVLRSTGFAGDDEDQF